MRNPCRFISASLILTICLVVAGYSQPKSAALSKSAMNDEQIRKSVRAVLDSQVQAWNRGDIDGFMRGYAKSDETVFVSGDTVTHGWQTVLERYKHTYDTREKMGTLAFNELEIRPQGTDVAVVLGRWQLTRANDTPHGRFTLIFRGTADGWLIVHDHTSSA